MIGRRRVIATALLAGALPPSDASATKAPRPKHHRGYSAAIDQLFAGWWLRDFAAFQAAFIDRDVEHPFDGRALFDAHYADQGVRFLGGNFFNGTMVVAQVVAPQGPNFEVGIEGGHALGEIFVVRFFPGLEKPVMESVTYIDTDVLAREEWIGLPNAPR